MRRIEREKKREEKETKKYEVAEAQREKREAAELKRRELAEAQKKKMEDEELRRRGRGSLLSWRLPKSRNPAQEPIARIRYQVGKNQVEKQTINSHDVLLECSLKTCEHPTSRRWVCCKECGLWFHCMCARVSWGKAQTDEFACGGCQ